MTALYVCPWKESDERESEKIVPSYSYLCQGMQSMVPCSRVQHTRWTIKSV
ncbi:uncharacterized protein G2W53_043320 [Senna tora]|uniref:Uncharacterized protein n=1 Tax=Senna tora TaxID=362788 RepID=A0A834SVC9_9FABA|nr:uncharacterized protein G2W53_043320 [Senna tora]